MTEAILDDAKMITFWEKNHLILYTNIQIKILSISETADFKVCTSTMFLLFLYIHHARIQLEVKFPLIFYSHLNHTVLIVINFIFYHFNFFFYFISFIFIYLFCISTCSALLGVANTYIHTLFLLLYVISSCQIVILSA